METTNITVQVSIAADQKKVWEYYTNPQHITHWNFASDDWQCPQASNDLRVGGKYFARMEAKDGSFGFDFEAIYDEIVIGEKIKYTMSDGRQAIVNFKSNGTQSDVTVTFDAETENPIDLQRNGWQAILNNFKKYCESQVNLQTKILSFNIVVHSSAEIAYNSMLGIKDISTYQHWTSVFNPSSTYVGAWEKGSKILFLGTDDNGKRAGMISRIIENIPNQFVSIQHYGIFENEVEITEGPQVEKWAGGIENYTFKEQDQQTTITVDLGVIEEYIDYFNQTYPLALTKLKELIEAL